MSLFGINRNCNSRSAAKMIHMQVPTWQGKENAFTERKRKLGGLRSKYPREGKGYPLQYSGLKNSMDCIGPWGHKESDTSERL